MASWALTVEVDGVDVSARVVGRVEWRAEANAARTGTLRLAMPPGPVDIGAFTGVPVLIAATWNGAPAVRRFTGYAARPQWDAQSRTLTLTLTDRLQNYFRTLFNGAGGGAAGITAVQGVLTGALWSGAVHAADGNPGDGWDVAEKLLGTVPWGFAISHAGADRWRPWDGGGAALAATLTKAGGTTLGDQPPSVELADAEDMVNSVGLTFEARGAMLHEWRLEFGWSSGIADACDAIAWLGNPYQLPTRDVIRSAAGSAGGWAIAQPETLTAGPGTGGFRFEGLPESGQYECGGPVPWILADVVEGDQAVTSVSWTAVQRWTQRSLRRYAITVEAPDSVDRLGSLVATDAASIDAESDLAWDGSGTSKRPSGLTWQGTTLHSWADVADLADIRDGAQCLAALAVRDILADHRRNRVTIPALPGDVLTVDIGDRARVVDDITATGFVEALEESWDVETGDAQTTLTLSVSRCVAIPSGSDDPLTIPDIGLTPSGYSLAGQEILNTYIGGDADSPEWNESMRGWITNRSIPADPDTLFDSVAFVVETPDVPDAARTTDIEGQQALTFNVYPPHEELTINNP